MKNKQPILRRIIREQQGATLPEGVKWSIVAGCVMFDAVCFYTTYDLLLRQNNLLNIFTVLISALTMDLFPVVLAMLLSRSRKNRMEIGMIVSIAVAFACEAAMSFFIRYNTRELLFKSGGLGLKLSGQAAQNVSQTSSAATSNAQLGIVILLGIIPILTSLLSYSVSYVNPERREWEKKTELLTDLKAQINNYKVSLDLLDEELKKRDLYKLDQTRFRVADILIDLAEVGSEIKVGQELAARLSDVDATTILTEDAQIQERLNQTRERLEKLIEETDYNEEEEEHEEND